MYNTLQKAFDVMVDHLHSMNGQSRIENNLWNKWFHRHKIGRCLYRKKNFFGKVTNMCVVGKLIPDDQYFEGWDTYDISAHTVFSLISHLFNTVDVPPEDWKSFLVCMQEIHDNPYNWSGNKFIGNLHEVAEKFNLKMK